MKAPVLLSVDDDVELSASDMYLVDEHNASALARSDMPRHEVIEVRVGFICGTYTLDDEPTTFKNMSELVSGFHISKGCEPDIEALISYRGQSPILSSPIATGLEGGPNA